MRFHTHHLTEHNICSCKLSVTSIVSLARIMKLLLTSEHFDTEPSSSAAGQGWLRTFENIVEVVPGENVNKHRHLTNYVFHRVYDTISECTPYENAICTLQAQYEKLTNEVFACHRVATRRKQNGETMNGYFSALKVLRKD